MTDVADAYRETQASLAALMASLGPDELATMVPASPDWSVHDVLAHVTGVAGDVVSGTANPALDVMEAWRDPVQAAMRDAMTAREVEERRGASTGELLEEWDRHLQLLLPMMRGERPFPWWIPFLPNILVTDLAVHVQDVRNALDRPGDRQSAGVGMALAGYAAGVGLKIQVLGLPPLLIRYGAKERLLGVGEPAAVWSGERYEIFRALAGRRSRDQILAMGWEGDPTPYVPLIPAYGERTDPLVEPAA